MVPLFALLGGFAAFRLIGVAGVDVLDSWQPALRAALALMLLFTAIPHFLPGWRDDMAAMIPPGLPYPRILVAVTGVLELACAAALLIPPLARWAALGLAALMLAMFPANVSAARRKLTLGGKPVTPLPLRTAIQVIFVAAAVAAAF
ncbi:DoxX family membrane protein [Saccharomonospora xinjiangensis]|uniref:Putative membrane protein n=1 Tax=Saccharomonospora xinjiangensis XJ-54 TaxID=882086 RepID=I0V046_9PSEU|nr:MauE/DoxX family redox-associated membrane protein [Saccharomonospora xinjiangensis]EID53499.1 putative membrane protein [Saccharomonospora xinjiangensis XJ-54]